MAVSVLRGADGYLHEPCREELKQNIDKFINKVTGNNS